jgi:hypothetical protein
MSLKKSKYKFIKWVAKKSSCADFYPFNNYSIAIVPLLENEISKKTVYGKTVYRITGVNEFNCEIMMETANYIAEHATKSFDNENEASHHKEVIKAFKSWRKDFEAKGAK